MDGGHLDLSGGTVIGTCRGLGMRKVRRQRICSLHGTENHAAKANGGTTIEVVVCIHHYPWIGITVHWIILSSSHLM